MSKPILAVDLGGTKILACVVRGGRVGAQRKVKTEIEAGPSAVVAQIRAAAAEALAAARLRWSQLGGIGVAVPGIVHPGSGVVLLAPNLGWKRFPARERLAKAFGRPVALANDVNAGLVGEYTHGALRAWRGGTVAGFFVGTGVGGGLIMDGRLLEGVSGGAGELGHMTLLADGPECGCGNRGCLEALASRTAVERSLGKRRGKATSGKLRRAYLKGDRKTVKALRSAADWLGVGVASVLNSFNPGAVVVGGGLMEALGRQLLPRVKASAKARALPSSYQDCRIVLSQLGDAAVPLGMAELTRATKPR